MGEHRHGGHQYSASAHIRGGCKPTETAGRCQINGLGGVRTRIPGSPYALRCRTTAMPSYIYGHIIQTVRERPVIQRPIFCYRTRRSPSEYSRFACLPCLLGVVASSFTTAYEIATMSHLLNRDRWSSTALSHAHSLNKTIVILYVRAINIQEETEASSRVPYREEAGR